MNENKSTTPVMPVGPVGSVGPVKPVKLVAGSQTLAGIQAMIQSCMQCGTCSASCPNAYAMDYTPRRMWRMILAGFIDEVLASKTFWLCSACYACTLRCPRGLPLTNAVGALKRLAREREGGHEDKNGAFYRVFLENVHKYGRVQEMDLMLHYFLAMGNALLPLEYTPLGLKLLFKGKLHPSATAQKGKLDALFGKVEQIEGRT